MAGLGLLERELTTLLTSLVPAGATRINPRLQENFVSQLVVIPVDDARVASLRNEIKGMTDAAPSPQVALKEIVSRIFNTMFSPDGLVNPACFGRIDNFAERYEFDHQVGLMIVLLKKICPENLWNSIEQRDRWLDALKHKFYMEHAGKTLGEAFDIEDVVDTANEQFGHLLSPPPAPRRASIFSPFSQAFGMAATPPASPVSPTLPASSMPPPRGVPAIHTRAESGGYEALTSPTGSLGGIVAAAPRSEPASGSESEGWCAFLLRTLCCCCLQTAPSREAEVARTPRLDLRTAAAARAMLASPTVERRFFPGSPTGMTVNPMQMRSPPGVAPGPLSPHARELAVARAAFLAAQQRVATARRNEGPAGAGVVSSGTR